MKNRILSVMLAMCMIIGMVPATTYASENRKTTGNVNSYTGNTTGTIGKSTVKNSVNADVPMTVNEGGELPPAVTTFTVTFDANGQGTAPQALTGVTNGATITAPIEPTAAGYTFGGWYKEKECTNVWDFTKDVVTADIILFAKWTAITQTAPVITSITATGDVYGYTEGTAKAVVSVTPSIDYTYTYQWYSNSTNANSGGIAISGATTATYVLPAGKVAGDYYFYCVVTATKVAGGQPTNLTSNAVTLTIEKKEIGITWGNTQFTYDGTSHVPKATATGLVGSDACTITVDGAQTNACADGATYTATAAALSNANYKLPSNNIITFTIAKAEMAVTAENVIKAYDGKAYGITVTVTKPANAAGCTIMYGETEGSYTLTTSPAYSTYGTRTVYYQVTDSSNNYKTYTGSATVSIADTTAPTGSISAGGKTTTGFVSSVTFTNYVYAPQKVTIEIEDSGSGADEIYYYVTQSAVSSTKIKELDEDKWELYEDPFSLTKEGKFIVYAKLMDVAGNTRYISTNGMVLDGTDPKISGISDGGEYCQSKSITVTDTNLDTVYVDSTKKTVSSGKCTFTLTGTGTGKEYTITATDKAGNETEYTVTLRGSHVYKDFVQKSVEGEWSTEVASCEYCDSSYKRYRKVADIMKEEDPSGGSVSMDVEVRAGAPSVSTTGFDTTLAKSLVTDAATQAAKGVDVEVYLDVNRQTSVAAADKTATENAVKQHSVSNLKEGLYLDMTLYSKKGTAAATKVTKTTLGKTIKVSIALPQELRGAGRNYYVVRVHSGSATVLNTTLKDNVITFETDRFSTYSIWYTEDAAVLAASTAGNANGTGNTNTSGNSTGVNGNQKDQVPQTGDEDYGFLYGILCLIGAVGCVYFGRKIVLKKRMEE